MATGRIGVTPTLGTRWSKAPAGGTTSLSGLDDNSVSLVYSVGYEAVYRNGVLLSRGNDYTATDGTTITLIDATIAGDIIEVFANQLVPLSDAISKGQFTAKGSLLSATAASTPAVLAVGSNNQILTADSSTATGLKWAAPAVTGLNWTQRKAPHGQSLRTIAYNGSNLYVAAGASGELFTSSDAITWTSRTSGFGAQAINKVFFGNGLWVAVGANGTITTSTDGTTWTARTSNMSTNELYDVIYANGNWVVVGDGGGSTNTGGIAYSTDGLTWTRKSQTPTIGTTYYTITWNDTNYVVGATLSTNNFLYASNPAGTWTAGNEANYNQAIEWLAYDGTRTIGLSNARYFYSTSATLATTEVYASDISNESNAAVQRQSISYYNGQVVAAALYYMVFTTAPTATTYPTTLNPLTLSPGAIRTTSTPFITNRTSSVFSGAIGVIVATSSGRIFTSF